MQIKFTTRSGSNAFIGSALPLLPERQAEHEHLLNSVRGLPKGALTLNQPGFRLGGPVVIPGVYDGRGKMFFFVNYEETAPAEHDHDATRRCCCRTRRTASSGTTAGRRAASTCIALAAANGHVVDAGSDRRASCCADIRNSTSSAAACSRRSPATSTPSATRSSSRPAVTSTTRRSASTTTCGTRTGCPARGTGRRFPDTSSTRPTPGSRPGPGFPLYGAQGSIRVRATPASLRSTLSAEPRQRSARRPTRAAPVEFSPNHRPGHVERAARQPGRLRARHQRRARHHQRRRRPCTPSARNATTLDRSRTRVNWLQGLAQHQPGRRVTASTTSGCDTRHDARAVDRFGTQTGDPALAMFTPRTSRAAARRERNNARALYAVLTGRVDAASARTARLDADTGQYVYNGDSRAEGRLRQSTSSSRTTGSCGRTCR